MALRMKARVEELKQHWTKMGVKNGLNVRMGIATGCTVGNFGSISVLTTPLGSQLIYQRVFKDLLQQMILFQRIPMSVFQRVEASHFDDILPKGFSRTVPVYKVQILFLKAIGTLESFLIEESGPSIIDTSDIRCVRIPWTEEFNEFQRLAVII